MLGWAMCSTEPDKNPVGDRVGPEAKWPGQVVNGGEDSIVSPLETFGCEGMQRGCVVAPKGCEVKGEYNFFLLWNILNTQRLGE